MEENPFHAAESVIIPITREIHFIFDPIWSADLIWAGSKKLTRLIKSIKKSRKKEQSYLQLSPKSQNLNFGRIGGNYPGNTRTVKKINLS